MTVESILFLYTLIVCLCLKNLVRPSKWRVELGVWEVAFFPFPDEIVCSFFNFLFDIFWNSTNLAYVTQLGEDDLVCDYLKRVSACFVYGLFYCTFIYFVPFGLIENRVTKSNLSILMEIVTIPVVLVDQFHFYMHQPIKTWLFKKIIFDNYLDYY